MKAVSKIVGACVGLSVLILCTAFILNNFIYIHKPLNLAINSTVLITSGDEQRGTLYGTGEIFINNNHTFIWTCHHVVENSIRLKVIYDTKLKKYRTDIVKYPIKISCKLFDGEGHEAGQILLWAKIIRFSAADDLALLEVPHGFLTNSIAFPPVRNYTPLVGSKIFHVGNFGGPDGERSVSEGIYGQCGLDLDNDGHSFDRVGLNFEPGSSGGGVFESGTGNCLGILARRINAHNTNQAYIIPARMVNEFACRLDCEWALYNSVEVPDDYLDVLSDDTIDLPQALINMLQKANN